MIWLGYWSKAKKKVFRRGRHRVRMTTNPIYAGKYRYKKYKKAYRYGKQKNDKYDLVGLSPNNWVSPIDFVPYVNVANKGRRVYKTSKKTRKYRKRVVRGVKTTYRAGKRVVGKTSSHSSPSSRIRRKSGARPYYYYKGKRIYYGNNKFRKGRK